MIIGYARVSTEEQSLDLQIDALQQKNIDEIFCEKKSGKSKDRPELELMPANIRKGDTVVVYKLDRISRSTTHLIHLVENFEQKGVDFISLQDNVDTSTAMGKFFFRVMASLAELERDILVERTNAGLVAARARGRKGGRPFTPKETINLALKMYRSKEYSISQILNVTGISKTTLYRYIRKGGRF
ncbi:recombinase family protein [Lactococcus lactis]|uniref:recombinase family protein n=1 Tax=Lactococcus lactis TaxID=1358 RepID=UPI0019136AFB|nr:recombinase family protein [Lactococcus lactis]MBK5077730.1 recombinase family protein [Lactococcus lactis]WDA67360.1 recombinase family protein [Lactococcus lactis]